MIAGEFKVSKIDLVNDLRRYGDGLPSGLLLMRKAAAELQRQSDEIEDLRGALEGIKAPILKAASFYGATIPEPFVSEMNR